MCHARSFFRFSLLLHLLLLFLLSLALLLLHTQSAYSSLADQAHHDSGNDSRAIVAACEARRAPNYPLPLDGDGESGLHLTAHRLLAGRCDAQHVSESARELCSSFVSLPHHSSFSSDSVSGTAAAFTLVRHSNQLPSFLHMISFFPLPFLRAFSSFHHPLPRTRAARCLLV